MKKRQVVLRRSADDHRCRSSVVRYGECQKNHAARVGRYAVDGCREFMPCGEEGSSGAMKCAACGCHRNFHRREVEPEMVCDGSSTTSSST